MPTSHCISTSHKLKCDIRGMYDLFIANEIPLSDCGHRHLELRVAPGAAGQASGLLRGVAVRAAGE